MNLKTKNCILCIMQPIVLFGSLSGYCCISSLGHHRDMRASDISLQVSKTKVALTVTFIALTLYYLLTHMWLMFNMKEFSADASIILLNEILSCLGDLSVKVYFLVKTGDKVQMLLTFQSTLNNPFQEASSCISAADIKYAKKRQFLFICIAFISLAIYVVVVGIFWDYEDLIQNQSMRVLVDLLMIYFNVTTISQINSELILIHLLFHKLSKGLIKVLTRKLTQTRSGANILTPISFVSRLTLRDVRNSYEQHCVSRDLQRLRYFHATAIKNFKVFNGYFNTSLVNWCSFVSVILMINSYIIVTSCLNPIEASATIVISSIARFIVYFSTMSMLLFHAQHIVDVVSVMHSVCFCNEDSDINN